METTPATDLAKLLTYACRRRAHASVIAMIDRARAGHLEALAAADKMWVTIARSPAAAELLAGEGGAAA